MTEGLYAYRNDIALLDPSVYWAKHEDQWGLGAAVFAACAKEYFERRKQNASESPKCTDRQLLQK